MAITPWRAEWNAISARIEGFIRTGEIFYQSIQKSSDRPSDTLDQTLIPESTELYNCVKAYKENYSKVLPAKLDNSINNLINKYDSLFSNKPDQQTSALDYQRRLLTLSAFRSEFEYHLFDIQDEIRLVSERAFVHLQRCIVADSEYKQKWQTAFKNHETACEKLGAIHLLWHGIWAFKVNAEGGRTDLVMGDKNADETAQQTSIGMVLTEWKCAKTENDVIYKYEQGINQASNYSSSVLGGIELADTRYIVVVTKKQITHESRTENNIKYKFINIAVDPDPPSVQARKSK